MTDTSRTTRYHFVMSGELPGRSSGTISGKFDLPPGTTRQEMYEAACEELSKHFGGQRPTVLFWSLEPDQLPTGGAS